MKGGILTKVMVFTKTAGVSKLSHVAHNVCVIRGVSGSPEKRDSYGGTYFSRIVGEPGGTGSARPQQ